MAQKVHDLFATVNSSGQTKDLEIPQGQTIIVESVDFSGPSFSGIGSKLIVDPDGDNMVIAAASGDKFVSYSATSGFQIVGSGTAGVDAKKLRIELKKVGPGAAVDLGCTVIYQEL